jgi:hypothetical protein
MGTFGWMATTNLFDALLRVGSVTTWKKAADRQTGANEATPTERQRERTVRRTTAKATAAFVVTIRKAIA